MPQVYIAAAITTAVSLAVWGLLFGVMARQHRRLWWMALLTLPLSFVINIWVKRPAFFLVAGLAGLSPTVTRTSPVWFILFAHLLAPVTEEAVKLMPLLSREWRGPLRDGAGAAEGTGTGGGGAALWAGMYLGAGFGLGEIWYLAWTIAAIPFYADYPFWQYTGFLNERTLTVYAHAVMTAVAVTGLAAAARGVRGAALRGFGAAVGLHSLTNVTALLFQLGIISALAAQGGLLLTVVLLTFIFQRLYARTRDPGSGQ